MTVSVVDCTREHVIECPELLNLSQPLKFRCIYEIPAKNDELACHYLLILREFNLTMYLVLDISALLKFMRKQVRVHESVAILRRQISPTQPDQLRASLVDWSASLVK